jgi:hypothetical protein
MFGSCFSCFKRNGENEREISLNEHDSQHNISELPMLAVNQWNTDIIINLCLNVLFSYEK